MKKLAVLLLLSSCVSNFNAIPVQKGVKHYPIDSENVKIFVTKDQLPEKEDIAILEISNSVLDGNYYEDIRQESAKVGGNGVILLSEEKSGLSIDLFNLDFSNKKTVKFLSFRYKVNGQYPERTSKRSENDSVYN